MGEPLHTDDKKNGQFTSFQQRNHEPDKDVKDLERVVSLAAAKVDELQLQLSLSDRHLFLTAALPRNTESPEAFALNGFRGNADPGARAARWVLTSESSQITGGTVFMEIAQGRPLAAHPEGCGRCRQRVWSAFPAEGHGASHEGTGVLAGYAPRQRS